MPILLKLLLSYDLSAFILLLQSDNLCPDRNSKSIVAGKELCSGLVP